MQEDRQRRAVDRRGRAAEARRRTIRCRKLSRAPRPVEAEGHLHRQAAADGQPATGRVHTNYAQAVAVTGRLSSNDPNLQNIPIRTAEGRRIREAFIAPPRLRRSSRADYSQIELRIMAHISRRRGPAARVRGRHGHAPRDRGRGVRRGAGRGQRASSAAMRRSINFGLIYGMSAFGLARNLGIERGAAQHYIERYFARYPGVEALHGRDARESARASTATSRRCSAGACACPRSTQRQRPAPRRPPSARRSTRRCRARPPT